MKTFNEWLGDRHSPQGLLVPIIKLGFNRRDELFALVLAVVE